VTDWVIRQGPTYLGFALAIVAVSLLLTISKQIEVAIQRLDAIAHLLRPSEPSLAETSLLTPGEMDEIF
jgi:hypothetical protein